MGSPGLNHRASMERFRRNLKFCEMAWFDQRRCFIRWWSARVARHELEVPSGHDEALSLGQLQRGRCFDKNETATEGDVSALRAVAGPLLGLHDNVDQTKLEPLPLCKDPCPEPP